MLYNDQPEMKVEMFRVMDDHFQRAHETGTMVDAVAVVQDGIAAAFDAIDRQELIGVAASEFMGGAPSTFSKDYEMAERILVRCGIIKKREE